MRNPPRPLLLALVVLFALVPAAGMAKLPPGGQFARIDHVADGDTVDLTNGQRVRLVQIDTPEVYYSPECYGKQASRITKRLLPPGTAVRLYPETEDRRGRRLRPPAPLRVPRPRRSRRQRPARAHRCSCSVLLRLPAWPLRPSLGAPRPPCSATPSRPLGPLPWDAVGPKPWRLDRAALGGVTVSSCMSIRGPSW